MLPDQKRSSSELSGKFEKADTDIPSSHERETGILGNKISYPEFPIKTTIKPYLAEVTENLWSYKSNKCSIVPTEKEKLLTSYIIFPV